jgi:GDPmannose 4,6-dehydratase
VSTAIVTGVSGQDGTYLVEDLCARGYRVVGTTRRAISETAAALQRLRLPPIELVQLDLENAAATDELLLRVKPDEVFHFAGQTSVGTSFAEPNTTYRSLALTSLNLLDAVRRVSPRTKLVVAGSGEVFGDTRGVRADEQTPNSPRSPYAAAKAAARDLVQTYRAAYGVFACTAILYNHESPRRPERFVTRKVVRGALDISRQRRSELALGALNVVRDWGWAPEYVAAVARLPGLTAPEDLVIATGESHSLEEFVRLAFENVGLNYEDYVKRDESLLRPSEIPAMSADPEKAARVLGFRAQVKLAEVVRRLVEAEKATA